MLEKPNKLQYVIRVLVFAVLTAGVLLSETSSAQHKGISFQAILKKPDGTYPTVSGVSVTLQVLTPSTDCVLREEVHSGVNISNGYINLVLGSGTATTPAGINPSPVLSIPQIMDNATARSGLNCIDSSNNIAASNQSYAPTNNDARKLRLRAVIGSDTIVADFNMRAMPFAVNAENLDGKTSSQFVQTSANITQTNVESIFSRYSVLDAILNGTYAGNAATATALAVAPGACPAGQYMSAMSASGTITCSTPAGSVTNVTSANSYLSVVTGTTTPVLTVNVGTVANTVAAGNDSRFTDARAPTGAAGGDLSGTYPNPTVAKIDGKAVVTTSLSSGEFLKFDGTNWVNATVSTSDATKLPLAGGTMSGAIDMGSQNLTNVGYVTMSSGKSLHLSNNASDPAGLVAADKGKMWFNSTSGQVKYWDGTTAQVVGNTANVIAIANGGTGQTTKAAGFDALSPTTTKGDIPVNNGTNNVRLPVGTDAYVLTADSSQSTGLKWSALPSAPGDATYAAKGLVQFDTDAATSGVRVSSGVASINTGTAANQIVKLDGSAKLPAVDGSALTNVTATSYNGILPIAKGGTNSSYGLTNDKIMVSAGGSIVESAGLMNGQILIGGTGIAPAVGNITGSNGAVITNGAGTIDVSTNAVSTNTASKLVTRDASGDFAAGVITNNSNVLKGATSGAVTMAVPATITSYTLTWPNAVGGAGSFLTTDASGNLSWGSPAAIADSSYAAKGAVQFLTDAATSGITIASGVANVNTGTAANQIVKLDGSAKLPAVDGSGLTNLTPANLSAAVPIAKGGTGQTTKAAGYDALSPNTTKGDIAVFNGTNNVRVPAGTDAYVLTADSSQAAGVKWSALPSAPGDASYAAKGLVQLETDAATSGIKISSGVASLNTGTGANQVVKLDGSAKLPAVDGSALTNLSAANISSGTLPIARGGTASTSFTPDALVVANATGSALISFPCTAGQYLTFGASGVPTCGSSTSGNSFVKDGNSFGAAAILGTNDAYPLHFETGGTTQMSILTSGDIGVGTTAPTNKLTVAVTAVGDGLGVSGTQVGFASPQISLYEGTTQKGAFGLAMGNGHYSYISKINDVVLRAVGAPSDGNLILTNQNATGNILFTTGSAWNNDTAKMTILNGGNVGIGSINPVTKLQVNTSSSYDGVSISGPEPLFSLTGSEASGINFSFMESGGYAFFKNNTNTAGGLLFRNSNNSDIFSMSFAAPASTLVLDSSGKIGINNNTPGALLDVGKAGSTLGTMRLEGNTSGYVQIQPAAAAGSWTMTLPADGGSNGYVLSTNGSGVTTWVPAGLSGTVAISNGGTGQTAKTAAFDALSPNTTKGDIAVHNGTNNVRLPAGTNNYVLTADSSQASGVKWAAAATPADASYSAKGVLQILTDAATSGLTIASGVLNVNSGTGANQIVKLDASSKLPAVDGSALTNLSAGNISSGTLPVARGGTGVTSITGDRMVVSNGTGSTLIPFNCAVGEFLSFNASGIPTCAAATGFVNGGNSFGADATLGTNDAYALNFETNNATKMTILSNGKVGIGTTSPASTLELNSTAANGGATELRMKNLSSSGNSKLVLYNENDSGWAGFQMNGSASPQGANTAAFTSSHDMSIVTDSGVQNGGSHKISFLTGGWDTSTQTRMTISSAGDVGIGTDTPTARVHVNSGTAQYPVGLQVDATNHAVSRRAGITVGDWNFGQDSAGDGYKNFYIWENSTSSTRFFIAPTTGYIGMGTTAPTSRLQVAGAIVSLPADYPTGATINLATSNTHTLTSVGGSSITLQNMANGGDYTIVINDSTSRTYTFGGCTTSKFKPANAATEAGTSTVYSVLSIWNGASFDCYITWATGYQ